MTASLHVPVLAREVAEILAPRDGAIYVDGTFGGGGYATRWLDGARCRVVGIDRDPRAARRAAAIVERYRPRLEVIEGRFGATFRRVEE